MKDSASFGFLKNTHMPATIVEIAFIDNDTSGAALAQPEWAEKVGQALARARLETMAD